MTENVTDDRGLGIRLRGILPGPLFRLITLTYNFLLGVFPESIKYSLGETLRRNRLPYRLIERGHTVVQVGAPRDILRAGRSRAAFFLRLVGPEGKVLVCEPDPENCRELEQFALRNGILGQLVIYSGALWHEPGELILLSSKSHPAANLLVNAAGAYDVSSVTAAEMKSRNYERIPVQVQTLDQVISDKQLPTPNLVSITTNGAEKEILQGMPDTLSQGVQFLALATTNSNYADEIATRGYQLLGLDDRGQTYQLDTPT